MNDAATAFPNVLAVAPVRWVSVIVTVAPPAVVPLVGVKSVIVGGGSYV